MKTKLFYSLMILFGILSSCTKDGVEVDNPKMQTTEIRTNRIAGRSPSVLDISSTRQNGKFKNPFYIGTVKAAYKKLKSQGVITNNYDLTPNTLYIRYLPKDETELNTLKMAEGMYLSEDPLQENDNSLETGHDDIIGTNQIPFQYTTCGIGGIKPGIEVDILDTLFLNFPTTIITQDDWVKIEKEIMISTGVIGPNDPGFNAIPFCDEWYPSGNIRIWDDALATNLPLKRVKVRVISWYQFADVYTNDSGNFTTSPFMYFCGKVRYAVRFENSIWDVRDGNLVQADFATPKMKTPFNHIIRTDAKHLGWGTVHRALVRYFFEDVAGLRRPFIFGEKLKISYKHEDGNTLGVMYPIGIEGSWLSHVYIYGFSNGALRPTQSIFGTTAHELGHVAHCHQMGNIQFWQVSNLIQESWARACQWKVTELEYGLSPDPVPGPIQDWFFDQEPIFNNYSPLFIDLEDTFNQSLTDPDTPNDPTGGYNLGFIQSNVLPHSYGLTSLRSRLKNQKPAGVTDAQIDSNLEHYFQHF
jgi:hypothetical protein